MDQPNDSLISAVQYVSGLLITGLMGAVAYIWRQLGKIESVGNRVDTLADAVEDLVARQDNMEHEQGDQRVLMAEMRNDVKWIRETLEQNHRK